jgi:hypothetical protein
VVRRPGRRPSATSGSAAWYYSSQNIHCPNCSCLEHKSGDKTYYHSAVTPVIVAAGRARWKIENENNNTLKTKGLEIGPYAKPP